MIILDTHVWIWWVSDPELLSKKTLKTIESANQIGIAAISCWEFATLVEKGRIQIDRNPLDWIEQSLEELKIDLLPLTPNVAVISTQLGRGFHGDPADRQIVATSLINSAALITKDKKISKFKPVESIW